MGSTSARLPQMHSYAAWWDPKGTVIIVWDIEAGREVLVISPRVLKKDDNASASIMEREVGDILDKYEPEHPGVVWFDYDPRGQPMPVKTEEPMPVKTEDTTPIDLRVTRHLCADCACRNVCMINKAFSEASVSVELSYCGGYTK